MPAIPQGYGPYGVPDPPCIEHLQVGALMGGLVGLGAGGLFSVASFSKSHYNTVALVQRVGIRTGTITLAFALFGVIASSLRCRR